MNKDLPFLIISLSSLIIFNLLLINIKLDITYLQTTTLLLILSMFSLAIFIYFSERIENKYLIFPSLVIQIVFSIINPILSIFIIPVVLLFFRDGERAISISITALFFIFFFLPVIYKPYSDTLMNNTLSILNTSLDRAIEDMIRQQVTLDTNYVKNLVLSGFDYAVQNLPMSNYTLALELRNNLSREIEIRGNQTLEMYLQNYREVFKENIINMINEYKTFISTAISLAIFTTIYLYLLFVRLYYHLLKSILDKHL